MNILRLHEKYNTDAKCIKYLEKQRFKNGLYCLHCGSDKVYRRSADYRFHCNHCNKDFTVLYKTIFENTKMPLPKWFQIIALMLNSKLGISAKEIQRNIGCTYKTAWYSAMRIRCAMIETPELIEGIVEMDEAYIGGKPRKNELKPNTPSLSFVEPANDKTKIKRGRGTKKVPIVGLVSRGKDGKVVTQVSKNLGQQQLLKILKKNVNTKESVLVTDEFKAYNNFEKYINHIRVKHSGKTKQANHTNTIEGFWSILKNGIKGNYRAISPKYLPFYLTEYAHKYNMRNQKNDFEVIIENATDSEKCMIKFKPKKEVDKIVYDKKKNKAIPLITKPLKAKKKASSKNITTKSNKIAKSTKKNENKLVVKSSEKQTSTRKIAIRSSRFRAKSTKIKQIKQQRNLKSKT